MAEEKQTNINEKTAEDIAEQKDIEAQGEVSRILRGKNDVFEKEYSFYGGDLKCKIKLKAPNAIDQGIIRSLQTSYLNGLVKFVMEEDRVIFWTLAVFNSNCAIEVPEMLSDAENVYNTTPHLTIGRDFQRWLAGFRY